MGYTIWPDGSTGDTLSKIYQERFRQEELKLRGKFTFTCADIEVTNSERLAVLAEEFGEVAREVTEQVIMLHKDQKEFTETGQRSVLAHIVKNQNQRMKKELIQVAAVCVAWCEALDKLESVITKVELNSRYGKDQIKEMNMVSAYPKFQCTDSQCTHPPECACQGGEYACAHSRSCL